MKKASKKMMNLLAEFLVSEIGGKAVDGITYQLFIDSDKTKPICDRYMELKNEAERCGFTNNDGFRAYKVSNGTIFDMDLSLSTAVLTKLMQSMPEGQATPEDYEQINNRPQIRRKHDMESLAKYVYTEAAKGNPEVSVALFSRNSSPSIMISARDIETGEPFTEKYNAYALRHWDIRTINEKLLIPKGIYIARICPCEILPSRTGVKFTLISERVE